MLNLSNSNELVAVYHNLPLSDPKSDPEDSHIKCIECLAEPVCESFSLKLIIGYICITNPHKRASHFSGDTKFHVFSKFISR